MTWVVTTIVAAGAITSAAGQRNAAEAQKIELEQQADQEALASKGRELERRQQLNKVLAANIVSQQISGTTGEGTPQSIALESAKQASSSEALLSLSDRLKQAQLRRQAASAKRQGNIAATSTLLKGATQVGKLQ